MDCVIHVTHEGGLVGSNHMLEGTERRADRHVDQNSPVKVRTNINNQTIPEYEVLDTQELARMEQLIKIAIDYSSSPEREVGTSEEDSRTLIRHK